MSYATDRRSGRSGALSSLIVRWLAGVGIFGGGGLFLLGFYIAGAQGVPRRYAIEPVPGPQMASLATVGALILVIGLIVAAVEAFRLARLPESAEHG